MICTCSRGYEHTCMHVHAHMGMHTLMGMHMDTHTHVCTHTPNLHRVVGGSRSFVGRRWDPPLEISPLRGPSGAGRGQWVGRRGSVLPSPPPPGPMNRLKHHTEPGLAKCSTCISGRSASPEAQGGGRGALSPAAPSSQSVTCPSDVVDTTPREAYVWEQRLDPRPDWAPRGDRRVDSTPQARPPARARGLRLLAMGAGSQGTQGVQWGGRRPSARGRAWAPRLQRPGSGFRLCRGAGSSVWRSPRASQRWPTQPHSSTCV